MNEHPSFLRLDRHALGKHDSSVAEHLASCPRCAAHVESIVPKLEVPEWVIRSEPAPRFAGWRRWAVIAAPLAAMVAGIYLSPSYLGVKGAPTVALYKKRGEHVAPWTGEAVQVGDALALRVNGAGFTHAEISVANDGALEVVHREEIGAGEVTLPLSLVVDARGERERIVVVFSRADGPETHTVELELKKEVP